MRRCGRRLQNGDTWIVVITDAAVTVGNEVEDGHKEDCALSLPNLATPALNRIKAEAYLEAAELVEAHHTWTTNVAAGKLLRTKADELGKEA